MTKGGTFSDAVISLAPVLVLLPPIVACIVTAVRMPDYRLFAPAGVLVALLAWSYCYLYGKCRLTRNNFGKEERQ